MARHPFDPVSFVVGVAALAAGAVVLAGGDLTDEARVLLPAGLIALGVALVVNVVDRRPGGTAAPGHDPAPTADGPDHATDPFGSGTPTTDVLPALGDDPPATDPDPLATASSTGDPDAAGAGEAGPPDAGTAERPR